MAKKVPWAENQFTQSFRNKSLRNTIMNTPIDTTRPRLSQEQIDQQHKKYSITEYASYSDFEAKNERYSRTAVIRELNAENKTFKSTKQKEKYIREQTTERLQSQWRFYEHREGLIETGQYDEIRTEQHRQQYISHLRMANVDADVIENIERLTPEQWSRLNAFPDVDPKSFKNRLLPNMRDIYSSTLEIDTDKYDVIKDEIKEAFESAGLKFIENKKADGQVDVIKRRKFPALAAAYYEGRFEIKRKANGHYSVPFIGSTDGKNAQTARDFIKYLDRVSIDYDVDDD